MARDIAIRSPESLVQHDEYQLLGKSVHAFTDDAHIELANAEKRTDALCHAALVHTGQIYAGTLRFAYKAFLLDRLLAAVGTQNLTVIGSPDLGDVTQLNWIPSVHAHIFAALARNMNDGPQVAEVPRISPAIFHDSFSHVPVFDRIFNVLSRPLAAVIHQTWVWLGARKTPGWRGTVLTGIATETVEESFISLAMRGWRIARLDFSICPTGKPLSVSLDTLEKALHSSWERHMSPHMSSKVRHAAWELFWPRLMQAIRNHACNLTATRDFVAATRTRHGNSAKPVAIYSSGLYSPSYRLLDACLREAKIPVICVDHGAGQGLGLRHDYTVREAISFSDYYLAFNSQAKKQFDSHISRSSQKVYVAGAPAIQTSKRLRSILRRAARRRLGVAGNEPLLLYVTNLANNNFPIGYGTSTDQFYAKFQRKLLEALSGFKGRVAVKAYPAHRYADPEQIWQIQLPANARQAPFGDFRHLRWAADIILLDLCSSTLGWAISADTPLIYVDNESNFMTERAAAQAKQGLLYIDARQVGWENRLAELIAEPIEVLRRDMNERCEARTRFDREFVTGPRGILHQTLHEVLDQLNPVSQPLNWRGRWKKRSRRNHERQA